MPPADPPTAPSRPASFLAAMTALRAIDEAVREARTDVDSDHGDGRARGTDPAGPDQALAALLLLREVRHQLAGWETGLIEAARDAGASWADLAHPLGVASRQAAERRYLRLRPGIEGSTGEERVQATRDRRAADRTVTAWARGHAADLRRLAGQITALTDLPTRADAPLRNLSRALADNDAANLVAPLADTRPHLQDHHRELAARVEDITRTMEQLRQNSGDQRRTAAP